MLMCEKAACVHAVRNRLRVCRGNIGVLTSIHASEPIYYLASRPAFHYQHISEDSHLLYSLSSLLCTVIWSRMPALNRSDSTGDAVGFVRY